MLPYLLSWGSVTLQEVTTLQIHHQLWCAVVLPTKLQTHALRRDLHVVGAAQWWDKSDLMNSVPFDSHLLVIGLWWQLYLSNIFIYSMQTPHSPGATLSICILHKLEVLLVSFPPFASPQMDAVFLFSCALQNWATSLPFASYCTCLTVLARTEKITL